jgi:hypothetical protein
MEYWVLKMDDGQILDSVSSYQHKYRSNPAKPIIPKLQSSFGGSTILHNPAMPGHGTANFL